MLIHGGATGTGMAGMPKGVIMDLIPITGTIP